MNRIIWIDDEIFWVSDRIFVCLLVKSFGWGSKDSGKYVICNLGKLCDFCGKWKLESCKVKMRSMSWNLL